MKYIHMPSIQHAESNTSTKKLFFTDAHIIELQRVFSTVGFYHLTVANKAEGRFIMTTMLQSLNCHKQVACLSMPDVHNGLPHEFLDLFYALTLEGYVTGSAIESKLDDFFIDQFDADFLWIEACDSLAAQPWFHLFEYKLAYFNIDRTMPIITLSFSCC